MKRILLALQVVVVGYVSGATPLLSASPPIEMLPGVVQAWQSVELSPAIGGVIAEIAVDESQWVAAGDLLVQLDDRLARASRAAAAAVAQREALVRRAELNVSLAEKYLARVQDAHRRNAASELELDEANGRLTEAVAGLAQAHEQRQEAEAQLALEQVRLEIHELRAPFSGQIMRISAKAGASVTPQNSLMRLTNLKRLRVTLHVPLRFFGKLEVGQSYPLWAELPIPCALNAMLQSQEPVIDAATETFRCTFEIDNQSLTLPAGFAVRLCQFADISHN